MLQNFTATFNKQKFTPEQSGDVYDPDTRLKKEAMKKRVEARIAEKKTTVKNTVPDAPNKYKTVGWVDNLADNEIFVFGSNQQGIHGKGAALDAKNKFGAVQGVGEGLTGQSYALPTKSTPYRSLTINEVSKNLDTFLQFAADNPDKTFKMSAIGTDLANFKPQEIADILFSKNIPNNVYVPESLFKLKGTNTKPKTFEVSTKGDAFGKQFSALNATFKEGPYAGRTIEDVWQNEIKKSGKRSLPGPDSILRPGDYQQSKDEYQKLWQMWADENPDLISQLKNKVDEGYSLVDSYAGDPNKTVNQAEALTNIVNKLDTPTNVVDDLAKQNELIDNFVNSIKTEGNLEFYVKHSGTTVGAGDIKYNPTIGRGSQIPGFYTEPLGIRDIKVMGGRGGTDAVSNYYKVQVNSNNLLIDAVSGQVTGTQSPITGIGKMYLGDQIDKIDWNIFEQETGLNFERDFVGANKDSLIPTYEIKNGKKFTRLDVQTFITNLESKGLTGDQIASALRKSGIEGFATGPINAQYEVVLIDPNDDLGIGNKLNIEDATEVDFINNRSKVNRIDTPGGSLGAAKLNDPNVFDEIVEEYTPGNKFLKEITGNIPGWVIVPIEQALESGLRMSGFPAAAALAKRLVQWELYTFAVSLGANAIGRGEGALVSPQLAQAHLILGNEEEFKKRAATMEKDMMRNSAEVGSGMMSAIIKAMPSYWKDEWLLKRNPEFTGWMEMFPDLAYVKTRAEKGLDWGIGKLFGNGK